MLKKLIAALVSGALLLTSHTNIAYAAQKDVTLKEKIGQMLMVGFDGMTLKPDDDVAKAIMNNELGGVVLFDYNYTTKTYERNIKNPEQVKALTQQLQNYAKKAAKQYQHKYTPLLIGIDYEGGKVNRLKESKGFPKTIEAADVHKLSDEEAITYANQMAQTLQELGINLDFAPVLDVNVNPDNPIIGKVGRSFSADSKEVSKYGAMFSKAFSRHGILCSYKHFPGHGSSTGDTHKGFVDVTETWQENELDPYKALLNQPDGCDMVMVAHVVHYGLDTKGYPASISKSIITDLLRNQLNYHGVVVTDDLQMKAITNQYGLHEAVRLTINAGSDILVFGNMLSDSAKDPSKIVDMIYADVKSGKIKESRINEAYERIMTLKQKLPVAQTSNAE